MIEGWNFLLRSCAHKSNSPPPPIRLASGLNFRRARAALSEAKLLPSRVSSRREFSERRRKQERLAKKPTRVELLLASHVQLARELTAAIVARAKSVLKSLIRPPPAPNIGPMGATHAHGGATFQCMQMAAARRERPEWRELIRPGEIQSLAFGIGVVARSLVHANGDRAASGAGLSVWLRALTKLTWPRERPFRAIGL